MGQYGEPQNRQRNDESAVHGVGPLGTLHDSQRRWHPGARFLWWAFLLPVALFAWSSWRLRGVARIGGYVLAAWVLLVGVLVVAAPAPPPTATTAASVGQTVPTVTTSGPSPVTVDPVAAPATDAPVVAAPAPVAPLARPAAAPARVVRPVAPRTTHPKPAPARPAPAAKALPAPGNAVGDTYTNVDGNQIQRPVAAAAQPAGATAKCQDGTWSFSQHHSGTCSGHGGVAQFL